MNAPLAGVLFLGCLIALDNSSGDQTFRYRASVVDVVDGNTVVLSNRTFQGNIKLAGTVVVKLDAVKAPEIDQPGGGIAKAYLSKLVQDKEILVVELTEMGMSRGAWVFVGPEERSVNGLLIEDGMVWLTKPSVNLAISYSKAKEAYDKMKETYPKIKERRVGIWNSTNAVPPWEWEVRRKSQSK